MKRHRDNCRVLFVNTGGVSACTITKISAWTSSQKKCPETESIRNWVWTLLTLNLELGNDSTSCTIRDHGKDVQICGEVTRDTVHHYLSWELQAAEDHRVLCRDTTRCDDVDTRTKQHHKVMHRRICNTTFVHTNYHSEHCMEFHRVIE